MIASIRRLERPAGILAFVGVQNGRIVERNVVQNGLIFVVFLFFGLGEKVLRWVGGCSFNDLFKMIYVFIYIYSLISEIWFDFQFLLGEQFCLKAVWRNDKRWYTPTTSPQQTAVPLSGILWWSMLVLWVGTLPSTWFTEESPVGRTLDHWTMDLLEEGANPEIHQFFKWQRFKRPFNATFH